MAYISSFERISQEEGRQLGMEMGRKEGLQEGLQKGLQEGRQEGRLALLVALLVKRFGPLDAAVQDRLAKADPQTLSAWALNFVDAASLEEVFRPQ